MDDPLSSDLEAITDSHVLRAKIRKEFKRSLSSLDLISCDLLVQRAEQPSKPPIPDQPLTSLTLAEVEFILNDLEVAHHLKETSLTLSVIEVAHLLRAWQICRFVDQGAHWDNLCGEDQDIGALNLLRGIHKLVKGRV